MNTNAAMFKGGAKFNSAQRVNRSLTAHVEKRALLWMAERAPRWISSDKLTALGLVAQIGAGVCYALARFDKHWLLAVVFCIVLNWLGDSLDGTLARVRGPYRRHARRRGADDGAWGERLPALADGDGDARCLSAALR